MEDPRPDPERVRDRVREDLDRDQRLKDGCSGCFDALARLVMPAILLGTLVASAG